MITIDQLLEFVDLDFEPRWVTKDECGAVAFWEKKPTADKKSHSWYCFMSENQVYPSLKLAEFYGKDWAECIYEVPRKEVIYNKIEKLKPTVRGFDEVPSMPTATDFLNKINELVEAINELKGE